MSSLTYGAKHMRMRNVRGKARNHNCVRCDEDGIDKLAQEWAQIHGESGEDPWSDYLPLCISCHRRYDRTHLAVAESNRRRKSETRKQYVIKDPEAFRKQQAANGHKGLGVPKVIKDPVAFRRMQQEKADLSALAIWAKKDNKGGDAK